MSEFPVTMRGADNVKLWAHEHEVEPAALNQLRNIAKLPPVDRVAVMPDVHLGKGATVGSVIAMRNAVSPSAVGVDIGCLDADTEFLSPNGWVRISEWDGHEVLGYDPESDVARFTVPEKYINLPCSEFYHFKNSKGMDQMLSEEHRILVFQGHKARGYMHSVMSPSGLASRSLEKGYYCTKASFLSGNDGVDISDDMLRVEVMVQADGRVRRTSLGNRVELHFRRDRKIVRAQHLLNAANIQHTVRIESSGSTRIAFTIPHTRGNKDFVPFYRANSAQLKIIVDECLHWDGHRGYRSHYSQTDKSAADFIQYAFAATGTRASLYSPGRQKEHHNDVWMVIPTKNSMVGYCVPEIVPSVNGRKYCFMVETGFFVARRNGHIFTTGNCGVSATLTSLTADDLPDDLHPIRTAVESKIPVGFNSHEHTPKLERIGLSTSPFQKLWDDSKALRADVSTALDTRAHRQLGTLGGGNHHLELSLDEEGRVWINLHSGSRNIGKELAERHITVAKELAHNQDLPDRDLAYFVSGTPEMDAYLYDLTWAQEYAKLNREVMLALFKRVISEQFEGVSFTDHISAHHNYVGRETVDDQEFIVTRKGAIRAGHGDMAVIPGSMGTGSYIVRGLGNPESLFSASHGAGRKMSRSAAKRAFTVEDLAAQTAGIECRKDQGVVDEIPGAYKDINQVIQAQDNLVEVVARLQTILCVKG